MVVADTTGTHMCNTHSIKNNSSSLQVRTCMSVSLFYILVFTASSMVRYVRDSALHKTLEWLEHNVRVPLQGSYFDIYVASPAKHAYMGYTQLDKTI